MCGWELDVKEDRWIRAAKVWLAGKRDRYLFSRVAELIAGTV